MQAFPHSTDSTQTQKKATKDRADPNRTYLYKNKRQSSVIK